MGIKHYSRPDGQGGVIIDVESMLGDVITVFKASGQSELELMSAVRVTWPRVAVEVSIPSSSKN